MRHLGRLARRTGRAVGSDAIPDKIILALDLSRCSEVLWARAICRGMLAHSERNKFDGRIAKCPPFAARMEFPS